MMANESCGLNPAGYFYKLQSQRRGIAYYIVSSTSKFCGVVLTIENPVMEYAMTGFSILEEKINF
jgi:hypothetical protein